MTQKDPFAHILTQGLRKPPLKLHKPEPETEEGEAPSTDPRRYQAFEAAPKPVRLLVQCAAGPPHAPSYGLLVNVI